MTDTVRSHRVAVVVWVLGGFVAMYVMALAIVHEMDSYPGGPKALARSVQVGVEAMRPLRWPAERLDTLGGYLTYHNVTLFTLFLCVYGAVQGARAIRGDEDRHSLEELLATGVSRTRLLAARAAGFAGVLLAVSVGIGLGLAAGMAAGDQSDLGGALVTEGAAGLAALVAYALGVLVSQLVATSRVAGGLAALLVVALQLVTNLSGEMGPFAFLTYLSPFHYANASRALVPGHGLDVVASLVLLLMAVALLALAAWALERRDYGAALWTRHRKQAPPAHRVRVQRPMLRTVWTASLLRGRIGLLAWSVSVGAYAAMMAALEPTVVDAWQAFEPYGRIAGGGAGISPSAQYLSLIAELVTPVVAAYVVTQASAWVADLAQGRVEVVLASPVSWSRLVRERVLAATAGALVITAAAVCGLAIGATAVGADVDAAGLLRAALCAVLLGAALAAVAAVAVAALRTGAATVAIAVFVSASYLLGLLVPLFGWPSWVGKLSVFTAYGHPYLGVPDLGGTLVLVALALGGAAAGAAIAERTPKVA